MSVKSMRIAQRTSLSTSCAEIRVDPNEPLVHDRNQS